MARLIGNVDATGSLSTSVPAPATNTSSVKLYMPFDVDVQDDSVSAHSFTASGGAAVSTTQSKFGGKSLYLDGNAKLETSASSDFTFGTNNFTFEGFMYCTTYGELISCFNGSHPYTGFTLSTNFNNTGKLELFMSDGSGYQTTTSTETYPQNEWVHFACVRAGAEILFFKNGLLNGTVALTRNPQNSNNYLRIGASNNGTGNRFFAGYLDDLRITNGLALYTQSFVPPSQAVGSSLTGTNETNSTTGFTEVYLPLDTNTNDATANYTITGTASVSSALAKFGGGSALFNTGTTHLTASGSQNAMAFTGPFTIEMWVYQTASPSGGGYTIAGAHNGSGWLLQLKPTTTRFYITGSNLAVFSETLTNNTWYHLAVVREESGGVVKFYLDGTLKATSASTPSTMPSNSDLFIGAYRSGSNSQNFKGYIDDFRILNFAKYTSNFTPPTSAATTTVSQTRNDLAVLYMPFDDSLEDKARNHPVTANGNAAISATQAKFGGKSLFIDASGDYLTVESNGDFKFGTNDFSISMFIRPDTINTSASAGSYAAILDYDASTLNGAHFTLHQKNQTLIWVVQSSIGLTTSNCLTANTWHHVAVVRSSGTTSIIVDGNTVGSFSDAQNYTDTVTRSLYVGKQNIANTRRFDGYIDDLLIVNGFAMNFAAAPTAASGGEVIGTTTDTRTFSSVWNLNSAEVTEAFKAGTWPS